MKYRKALVDCSILTRTMPLDSIPTTTATEEDGAAPKAMTTNATRRRSLSLAEPQPSVETVIVKAKRAAQSLWMLLHAQVSDLELITFEEMISLFPPPTSSII